MKHAGFVMKIKNQLP